MKKSVVIFLTVLIYSIFVNAQEPIHKRTRWIDMGIDSSGVRMHLSFNFFEQDLYIQLPDTTKKIGTKKYATRCRYKLINLTNNEIEISEIIITATYSGRRYDVFNSKESIIIQPWHDYYGWFLTPKLRSAGKTANRVYMNVKSRTIYE